MFTTRNAPAPCIDKIKSISKRLSGSALAPAWAGRRPSMKTILVAEDNAICREPIAATLRLNHYQTLEASNGAEALRLVLENQPDLILLDLSMPVMDGLTFLGKLREADVTPKTPVIVLTATTDRDAVLQAAQMGVSSFLLKSNFSNAELIARVHSILGATEPDAIEQASASQVPSKSKAASATKTAQPRADATSAPAAATTRGLTKAQVLARLNQEIDLRSIKPILEYVIALTRSGTSTLDDIAAAIRQDQALSLKVLRVANSSFYQRGKVAKNLVEATQRIGLTAVRNAVIAILSIEHFDQATGAGLIPQRFWEHSLATGMLAEMIGEETSQANADQLFLAGLLHDVGRMVLGTIFQNEYSAVIAKSRDTGMDLEAVEMETFEVSHADATRALLKHWSISPSIIEAASLHGAPIEQHRNSKDDAKGLMAVALANRMAHALIAGGSGNTQLLPYHEFASELGLDHVAIERLAAAALSKLTDIQLFYAAQSSENFGDSLGSELASCAKTAPRVVVLGSDAPGDPYSLFFNQLGWLKPEQPTVAIVLARTQLDLKRYVTALKKLDSTDRGVIPLVVATFGQDLEIPPEISSNRPTETISLPCDYSHLVDTVTRCSAAALEELAAPI